MKENILQLTDADLNASSHDTQKIDISIYYLDKDSKAFAVKIKKSKIVNGAYETTDKIIGNTYTMTKNCATKGTGLAIIKEQVDAAVAQGVTAIHVAVGSVLDVELPVQYTLVVEGGKLIRK